MPASTRPDVVARSRRARAGRWAARAAVGAVLTAVGISAGVATTAAWPTTAQTRQYSATVRLSSDPALRSTLHSRTVFGDLDVAFDSPVPAPGVDVSVQVRDSIASVLAGRGLDIRSLQPSQAELDAAMTSAAWRVGGKALLGIAVVMTLAWFLLAFRHGIAPMWLPPVAGLLAAALLGGSLATAYRPTAFAAVRTTGLISLVRASTGILGDVEKRAQEATPYVRNMLALTAALEERYSAGTVDDRAAVKLIAVSDVHGANQYPLLKSLVEQEQATAVIDSGDLVNFGSVREAEAAGLFAGIESLGVPYIFVRGNHDANSPTDDALTQRLRNVKNVVVLEPQREKQYTVATIGGLTIAGFGDPRWFGDGGRNTGEMQKPAVAAFERAMTALEDGTAQTDFTGDRTQPLDLLVGHEPSSVEGLGALARIRIHGHLHSQSLAGSRIQLGSFTGGGVVAHYIEGNDGAELAGQPYAFDVLAYGPSCRLSRLTRYQFTDLLEGRPTYDTVQVINGAAVQGPVPEGRTCSPSEPMTTATVEAPAQASASPTPSETPSVSPSLPSGSPTPTVTEMRPTPAPAATTR